MIKIKLESSGWPSNCVSQRYHDELPIDLLYLSDEEVNEVLELRSKREDYIERTNREYEIKLKNIKYNPGLRYISKLCLNNLCKFYMI